MNTSGKVWGKTIELLSNASCSLHRLEVAKGGYCSKHRHLSKFNGFYVETGRVLVRIWKENGMVDETTLLPGDVMTVAAREFHQFEALEDSVMFELYWAELENDDIERETQGGRR